MIKICLKHTWSPYTKDRCIAFKAFTTYNKSVKRATLLEAKKVESGDEGLSPAAGDVTTSSAIVAAAVASMATTQPVPVSMALDTSSPEEQSPISENDSRNDENEDK